jgi:hypothetical protein
VSDALASTGGSKEEQTNALPKADDGSNGLEGPKSAASMFPAVGLSVVAATPLDAGFNPAVATDGNTGGQKGKKGKGRGGGGRGGRGAHRGGGKVSRAGVAGSGGAEGLQLPVGRREVLGPDGKPLAYDPVRDKIAELLTGTMERDFIVVKLRPSCQLCKRYITGGAGLRVMYRCKQCYLQVSC